MVKIKILIYSFGTCFLIRTSNGPWRLLTGDNPKKRGKLSKRSKGGYAMPRGPKRKVMLREAEWQSS